MASSIKRPRPAAIIAMAAIALCLGLSAGGQPYAQGAETRILVSLPAHAYWVDRIWGQKGVALPVIGPGQDPHSYDPSVSQARAFAKADLYFRTGLDFERKFMDTLLRVKPGLQAVDLRQGVKLRKLEAHSHAPGQLAHESDDDPHIWFGTREALIQIATIRDALSARYPARSSQIEAGYRSLAAEIEALDEELGKALAPLRGSSIVVYHPAFGYFFDRYGLTQLPVEISGREPSPRQLQAVIDKALSAGVTVVWAQPEYADRTAAALAVAIGAKVVKVKENDADWPAHLRALAEAARK